MRASPIDHRVGLEVTEASATLKPVWQRGAPPGDRHFSWLWAGKTRHRGIGSAASTHLGVACNLIRLPDLNKHPGAS
jgi:hypothetical protein